MLSFFISQGDRVSGASIEGKGEMEDPLQTPELVQ
jgi:hypothetical protein